MISVDEPLEMGPNDLVSSEIEVCALVRYGGIISSLHHGAIAVSKEHFGPVLVKWLFERYQSLGAHLIS